MVLGILGEEGAVHSGNLGVVRRYCDSDAPSDVWAPLASLAPLPQDAEGLRGFFPVCGWFTILLSPSRALHSKGISECRWRGFMSCRADPEASVEPQNRDGAMVAFPSTSLLLFQRSRVHLHLLISRPHSKVQGSPSFVPNSGTQTSMPDSI